MNQVVIERGKVPACLLIATGLGVTRNAFGIVQLTDFVTQTHESLMMKGMSAQAARSDWSAGWVWCPWASIRLSP